MVANASGSAEAGVLNPLPLLPDLGAFGLSAWLRLQIEVLRSEDWDVTGSLTRSATSAEPEPSDDEEVG
jgi:hypothetical protein